MQEMSGVGEIKQVPKKLGRPKGSPNRSTVEFKQTVQQLLDDNRENVARWLALVADGDDNSKPDPGRALDLMAKLAEYAAPKLARTVVAGDPDAPLEARCRWVE